MGLISTLKELLGMETQEAPQRHDVEVTVEREADAGSERAVKEPVASATSSEDAGTATATTSDTAATSDADTATTGESAETEDTETSESATSEPGDAEAGEVETEDETEDIETDEPDTAESEPAAGDTESSDESTEAAEPVQSIKGIGSAYAERLGTAGIETVGELADADPDAIAAEAEVPQARLEDWIERAKAKR